MTFFTHRAKFFNERQLTVNPAPDLPLEAMTPPSFFLGGLTVLAGAWMGKSGSGWLSTPLAAVLMFLGMTMVYKAASGDGRYVRPPIAVGPI